MSAKGGVVGGDGGEGGVGFEAGKVVEGGVGQEVGAAAEGREEGGFAVAPAGKAVFGQVEDAVEPGAEGRRVHERRPIPPDEHGPQFGGAVAVAVEDGVGVEEVRQGGEVFHEPGVEGRGREGVAEGLGADGAEFEGAAVGEVHEFEGAQPADVGGGRDEVAGAVGGGGGVPPVGLMAGTAVVSSASSWTWEAQEKRPKSGWSWKRGAPPYLA